MVGLGGEQTAGAPAPFLGPFPNRFGHPRITLGRLLPFGAPIAQPRTAETQPRASLATAIAPGQLLAAALPPRPSNSSLRVRELAWRQAHREDLRAYAGQWVVLEGEELVAHGPTPAGVVAQAKARGIHVPYVFFVEPIDDNVVRMGL